MHKSMFDPRLMAKSMSSTENDYAEVNAVHSYVHESADVADGEGDWQSIERAFRHRKRMEDWFRGEVCAEHFGRKRR